MNIKIDSTIFRDYDIRGIYPSQINESTFRIIGRSIATYLQVKEVAVGRDSRLSSPSLFAALTSGLMQQGVNVVDLGLISTEMHYFASGRFAYEANIIISASHNPPEYNGIKMVIKGVVPLHGEYGLPEIKKLTLKNTFPHIAKTGNLKSLDIMDEWIDHVLSFVDIPKLKKFKVVVDAGNGMGGISWEKLMGKLPLEIIPLYFEPDGRFPNHLPDPSNKDNLSSLQKKIVREKADLGFALDGDADRLFVLDEEGRILSGTLTSAILSEALLKKFGPSPILYNVVCGRIVPEIVKQLGGTPIRVRVGHSFIKQAMKKNHALFAGEHSGHFYFRDNFFADSSLIAGLILLEHLSLQNKTLSQLVKKYDKYPSSGEINFKVNNQKKLIDNLQNKFSDADIDWIDGLSIWQKNWWCNLRASKTEPYVRLNIEADNSQILKERIIFFEKLITSLGGKKI